MKRAIYAAIIATICTSVVALPTSPAAASSDPLAAWRVALAASDTTPANVVWLGSSTTYGNNATSPEKRYVNLVTNHLRGDQGPEAVVRPASTYPTRNTAPGVHGYLSAAGGATSETYVNDSTRPWILWERPSLIVHMIGSNDSIDAEPYAVTAAEYEASVAAEVDKLDAGAHTPISHVLVHTYRRAGTTVEKWATYREALERVAAARTNVLVVDISAEYEQADHLGADPCGLIDTDGVHQTDAGHAFMAKLLAPHLPRRLVVEAEPATDPAPTSPTPTPIVLAPETAQAGPTYPGRPRKVRAIERGAKVVVKWRQADAAERYVVRCGKASKRAKGTRAVLRSQAGRCKVRAVAEAGTSRWVRVRVRH